MSLILENLQKSLNVKSIFRVGLEFILWAVFTNNKNDVHIGVINFFVMYFSSW